MLLVTLFVFVGRWWSIYVTSGLKKNCHFQLNSHRRHIFVFCIVVFVYCTANEESQDAIQRLMLKRGTKCVKEKKAVTGTCVSHQLYQCGRRVWGSSLASISCHHGLNGTDAFDLKDTKRWRDERTVKRTVDAYCVGYIFSLTGCCRWCCRRRWWSCWQWENGPCFPRVPRLVSSRRLNCFSGVTPTGGVYRASFFFFFFLFFFSLPSLSLSVL